MEFEGRVSGAGDEVSHAAGGRTAHAGEDVADVAVLFPVNLTELAHSEVLTYSLA